MAISPPSDIVLDVAKAVDPLHYREAVGKLARLSNENLDVAESFDRLLGGFQPAAEAPASPANAPDPRRADLRSRLTPPVAAASADAGRPYEQLEAFVLQTFIQGMLPKTSESVYGQGLAGSFWSSMLAEQIATQLAKAGGIGIADLLAAPHGGGASALRGTLAAMQLGFADPDGQMAEEGG